MNYLHQLYEKFFGSGEEYTEPRKIVAFGNVLIDRTAKLNNNVLLDQYQLKWEARGELDVETLTALTADACDNTPCDENPGGSALNTVRILKLLGTDALFFGAVGQDDNANKIKDLLKQKNIESRLETIDEVPTGQCICLVYNDKTSLYANIAASAKFSVDFLRLENHNRPFLRPIERRQILYVEGFFVPQRQPVCEYLINNFIRERRRLAVNLSAVYIVKENFPEIMHLVRHAYFVFGNEDEFKVLMEKMGCANKDQMAKSLLHQCPKILLITKGAGGVELIANVETESDEPKEISFQCFHAPRVESVVDTTGAGDGFVAGFLHSWLEKRSLSECIRIATDVSAKIVTQIGCNLPE